MIQVVQVVFDELVDLCRQKILEKSQMSCVDADDRRLREIVGVDQLQKSAVSADTNDQIRVPAELVGDPESGMKQFLLTFCGDLPGSLRLIGIDEYGSVHWFSFGPGACSRIRGSAV